MNIVRVVLVLLTAYNLLLNPTVGIELWFGYREIFVQTLASQGGNEIGLYMISDVVVMVIGMIAAWFA
ncbi:hypothetical protein [Halorarum salinum]|uniref:Uncharacterized protein n=1 Tax=Halorarum salinum TaxID=2743089 RepID=A0A7D5LCC6_9EURY|nr:hypothetical protein [Halobaculum salinum]QLG63194.1 hypothetical protein HUG12_16225 [Halobaculum salinum]